MPPITIRIPTQAELLAMQQNPNSLLAQYNASNTPKPAVGSPGAVTPTAPGFGKPGSAVPINQYNDPAWVQSMTEMLNQINLKGQQEANSARIPGAAGLEKTSSANIANELGGMVPNDVFRELGQRAAERGVFTGSPSGANSTADLMRALGLTSLDMTNLGQKHLTEAYGRNPAAPLANPQGLVTTPAQAEALRLQRENMELDYRARMAAIEAARDRTRAGYGGGGYPHSGGGGGGFAPATNWQGANPTPITQPWHLPYSLDQGGGANNAQWTPGTYTDDMNPLYGYTQEPGLPNTVPGGSPWQPPPFDMGGLDDILGGGVGDVNTGGMSQDELDWLYNVGG